jgi:hypothetical protein
MALGVVATLVTGSIETLRTVATQPQAVEILTQYAFQESKAPSPRDQSAS